MRKSIFAIRLFATLGMIAAGTTGASSGPIAYLEFNDFVKSLHTARPDAYVGRSATVVQNAGSFERMRQYLLKLYDGVSVSHSFELDAQVFDCVGLMQQPGVRLGESKTIAAPPPPMPDLPGGRMQDRSGSHDAFGSLQHCPSGTIPMRRLTLPELTRFRTLEQFLRKSPGGDTGFDNAPADPNGHSYSVGSQGVTNYGGYDFLNLWNPKVLTAKGETFSLSQHWYVGGSGTGLQTAETGWQVYPVKYSTNNAVLFIYYTADGYHSTGCYNLDCGAFVQTNNNWHLGAGFTHYSKSGGKQWEVALGYYFYQGNWWLAAGSDWVGYYPGSVYKGGQLTHYAQVIEYGGEVCCQGGKAWPQMGSGAFASLGYQYAAYHRYILYRDANNNGYNPTLSIYTPSPACYTFSGPYYSSSWLTYFYFGGPGGAEKTC
jgi:hypothetical protein